MMNLLKITGSFLLVVFIACILNLFFFYEPGRFNIKFYQHSVSDFSLKLPAENEHELRSILNQPYHYLGLGKQMIAFESQDQRYVLKLFNKRPPLKKYWYTQLKHWKKCFSLHWFSHVYLKKDERLKKMFARTCLAFNHLKDETGLIFVCFNQDLSFDPRIVVHDSKNIQHSVSLKGCPFVIQKKVEITKDRIERLIREKNWDALHLTISQTKQLLMKRAEKGITDRIQTMHNNFGCTEEGAIQLDFGRIHFDPAIKDNPEIEKNRVMLQFETWLSNHFSIPSNS